MRYVLALLMLTAGCAGYRVTKADSPPLRPSAAPPQGMAQVCVFRLGWPAPKVVIAVRDNGRLVGGTRGSGYFCYLAQPGVHRILSQSPDAKDEIRLEAKGDERYYLQQNVEDYFGAVHAFAAWVDEAEALRRMSECDYYLLSDAPGSDELPRSVPRAPAARE